MDAKPEFSPADRDAETKQMLEAVKAVLGERCKDFTLMAVIDGAFYYWTSSTISAYGMGTKILMDIERQWAEDSGDDDE